MKLSNRDWVQLSSYLDGEMDPREIIKFEERLRIEPDLQHALDELRQAKYVLRQTPKLKVPRNFLLTPAMVGARKRPQPVRGYRLASALMTFLLVGVLVLDFGRGFTSKSMAPAAPREVMVEEMSDAAADALEEPALLEAQSEMEADRAAEEIEAEAPAEETLSPAVAAEVSEDEETVGLAEEGQITSTGAAEPDTAANQADEWQEDEVVEELILPSQEIVSKIPGTGVPESPPEGALPEEELLQVEREPIIDPFRTLEILLGLGALSFGAAAWLTRRKS